MQQRRGGTAADPVLLLLHSHNSHKWPAPACGGAEETRMNKEAAPATSPTWPEKIVNVSTVTASLHAFL